MTCIKGFGIISSHARSQTDQKTQTYLANPFVCMCLFHRFATFARFVRFDADTFVSATDNSADTLKTCPFTQNDCNVKRYNDTCTNFNDD